MVVDVVDDEDEDVDDVAVGDVVEDIVALVVIGTANVVEPKLRIKFTTNEFAATQTIQIPTKIPQLIFRTAPCQ
jgi:hypothetical protein